MRFEETQKTNQIHQYNSCRRHIPTFADLILKRFILNNLKFTMGRALETCPGAAFCIISLLRKQNKQGSGDNLML